MAIRCASKAIIVKNGCILLNRCIHEDGGIYYDLPGGGQNQYESLEEAVVREVKEETGYDACVLRFAALAEEIYTDISLRIRYPDYSHRILHIFLMSITDECRDVPSEKDFSMEESVWIPLSEVEKLPEICPSSLKKALPEILESEAPLYLGTEYVDWSRT